MLALLRAHPDPGFPAPCRLRLDEVELVERTSSYGGYGGGGGSGGSRVSGSGTAAAALRMSGTVMNAVAVGLSPWRWFSTGAGGGVVAGSAGGGGGLAEATAATAGANEFGTAGSFSQVCVIRLWRWEAAVT